MGNAGTYPLGPKETLSSLLLRAGSVTAGAFLPGAVLTRRAALDAQAKELSALVARVEAAAWARPGDRERTERFLETLRSLSPAGRVPIRLLHPRLLKGTEADIPLEDGDDLFIPPATGVVTVAGAVARPGRYSAPPSGRPSECFRAAGGLLPSADRRRILLVKARGTAAPLAQGVILWSEARGRFEVAAFSPDRPKIEPGDALVVPQDTASLPWTRELRDFPSVLARIIEITGTVVLP